MHQEETPGMSARKRAKSSHAAREAKVRAANLALGLATPQTAPNSSSKQQQQQRLLSTGDTGGSPMDYLSSPMRTTSGGAAVRAPLSALFSTMPVESSPRTTSTGAPAQTLAPLPPFSPLSFLHAMNSPAPSATTRRQHHLQQQQATFLAVPTSGLMPPPPSAHGASLPFASPPSKRRHPLSTPLSGSATPVRPGSSRTRRHEDDDVLMSLEGAAPTGATQGERPIRDHTPTPSEPIDEDTQLEKKARRMPADRADSVMVE